MFKLFKFYICLAYWKNRFRNSTMQNDRSDDSLCSHIENFTSKC